MQKDTFEIWSPQLRNRRSVDVYLPESYGAGRRRYPVVYMQDGQNLQDPAIAFAGNTWHLEDGLLWLAGRGIEPIVVGVHNTGVDRMNEYSPFKDPHNGGGAGARYARFLTETVKARLDASYRTEPGRASTVIAGSSMGGLISLYAFFRHPEVFGFAGVLSPSLWLTEAATFAFIRQADFSPGKLYLDVGAREGERHVANAQRLRDLLEEKGYRLGHDLMWVEEEMGAHHEAAWARRFQDALPFLVPGAAELAQSDLLARLAAKSSLRPATITGSDEHRGSRLRAKPPTEE